MGSQQDGAEGKLLKLNQKRLFALFCHRFFQLLRYGKPETRQFYLSGEPE